MTATEVSVLLATVLAGISSVLAALAALVQAFRVGTRLQDVKHDLNGRLDQLLAEREERVRTEALLHAARQKLEALPSPPAVGRADPFIRRIGPDDPERSE